MRRAAVAAVLAALAVPAAAQGAEYFNGDAGHGARVSTAGRTIEHLEIYCAGSSYYDREFAFSVARLIHVGRGGRFSYRGLAYRYGPERQPRGDQQVRLSGRLSSTGVRLRWSLPGCGTGTASAPRAR
jgi:hypothetical protein